ncbi:hypothetical protein BX600DRAFT_473351 [Xylariales sp. PMI_506]|nr:hypothetical protein BX600DRAFT_473351 [Xylariales sp. PMI_506]
MAKYVSTLILLLLSLALSGLVEAQANTTTSSEVEELLGELPTCAYLCLKSALASSSCSSTDVECQCTDATFLGISAECIAVSCTIQQSLVAKNVSETMCGAPVRDKSVEYVIITYVLVAISGVVVLARLSYNQFVSSNGLGADDWFILLTLIASVPSAIINVKFQAPNGMGKDIWTLTPDQITEFAKWFWINAILYFMDVWVLKLSILFFYLRIFPGKLIQRLLWGTVIFDILFGIAFMFAVSFQCLPVSYNWTNWMGEGGGTCVNINAITWADAGVSILLGVWMLAIPLSQLPKLKLHWRKKIGVACMFFVGTFVTVVSIIRLTSLVEFRSSANLTWDYWSVALWSSVEITIGMICACMPSLRVMLMRVMPGILGSTRDQSNKYYQRYGSGADKRTGDFQGSGLGGSRGPRDPSSLRIYKSTDWYITEDASDEAFQHRSPGEGSAAAPGHTIHMDTFDGPAQAR